MGKCISKKQRPRDLENANNPSSPVILITSRDIKVSPKNPGIESEFKHKLVNSLELTRKNLKQKNAVIDSRVKNAKNNDLPTGTQVEKTKTQQDSNLIKASLQKHIIFNSLTETQISLIIEDIKLYSLKSREIVFEQNSKGSAYFIVSSGRLEVLVNNKRVNLLNEGDSFGELALLHDTPRSATVKAIADSTLWMLDRKFFKKIVEEINDSNYNQHKDFVESLPLFKILSASQKESLVVCLTDLKFMPSQKIVNEGDPGDLFYIIKSGSVVCSKNGKEIRKMGKGEYFGEQTLLYGTPRGATVTALEEVTCVVLSKKDLEDSLGSSLQLIIYKNSMRMAIETNENLKKLTKIQVERLITETNISRYENNEVVIKSGVPKKNGVFIIVKGELRTESGKVVKNFSVIGEADVINDEEDKYSENFLSVGEVDIAFISNPGFHNCIGGEFLEVTNNNEAIELLKRVQFFRGLDQSQFKSLVKAIKIQEYSNGEKIVEQNNPGDCFFLIKNGKVDVVKDGVVIRNITKNDYFGERSLLFNNVRSASVIARKKVVCWVLYRQDFLELLNEKLKKQLIDRIELQDDTVLLSDLTIVRTLGSGMFGNVFLTVHKTKRTLGALKTVSRKKIECYEIEENISLERKIMLQLDHVLIVKLVKTFKDSKRLYFLMEYICGMDLFDVLRKLDLLKECDARFYIACIIIIIEHLHERGIIYRDLKPENMVIDSEGYPRLIDFGTAKFVSGRTYTIVGTPHYMAPEVITSHGYGLSADIWSIGIMLYEFMFGCVPFGEEDTDPYVIYEKVQERKLIFPRWVDNKNKIKEFVNQLLSKNPAARLGGNFDNLKNSFWFVGFNWDKILTKELKPPYIPKLPALNYDIESALKNPRPLEDAILSVENVDVVENKMRKSVPNLGWDADF